MALKATNRLKEGREKETGSSKVGEREREERDMRNEGRRKAAQYGR